MTKHAPKVTSSFRTRRASVTATIRHSSNIVARPCFRAQPVRSSVHTTPRRSVVRTPVVQPVNTSARNGLRTITDSTPTVKSEVASASHRRVHPTSTKHLQAVFMGLAYLERGWLGADAGADPPRIVKSTLSFLAKMRAHRLKHADYRSRPHCPGCNGVCAIKDYSMRKLEQARRTGNEAQVKSVERIVRSIDA